MSHEPASAMPAAEVAILPYSCVVGQEDVKLALELAFVEPRLGGVLLSGHRGTAKSTAVRAFARMAWGTLPATLPIHATEDRVVGGWRIEQLLRSKPEWQPGVLEEAHDRMLYIDEVNLLDDHVVNLILDAAATGVLVVQREGRRDEKAVRFSLVGTMNPEEGGLRAQLLDRFGLAVLVEGTKTDADRRDILRNRLLFDRADQGLLSEAATKDSALRTSLEAARRAAAAQSIPDAVLDKCVAAARAFHVEGHRAELTLALAARAHAAIKGQPVSANDVDAVARLALVHRRKDLTSDRLVWDRTKDDQTVREAR